MSILIPTCNRPYFFEKALKSALNQTYTNIEVIICDNSSNPQTEQIVRRYQSKRSELSIRYVKNGSNIGPIANQRKCLKLATGSYINFLMDDDLLHPQKIEKMLPFLTNNKNIALVTSRRLVIDDSGSPVKLLPKKEPFRIRQRAKYHLNGKEISTMMLRDQVNYIGEPTTVLFRKADLTEPFGNYSGKQAYNNVDVASWLNLLTSKNAVYITQPLSFFRKHSEQISKSVPSHMACLCDWIDHILDAHRLGVFDNQAEFVQAMQQLRRPILHQIPKWNSSTGGIYQAILIEKLRQIIGAIERIKSLDSLTEEFKALLANLENGSVK